MINSFNCIKHNLTFRAGRFLTCLVLIIVLVVVFIIRAMEFWNAKLNFIEYSIIGQLNCHVVFSSLQDCEVARRFSYYNALRMNTATKASIRCNYLPFWRERSPLYLVERKPGAFFPTFSQRIERETTGSTQSCWVGRGKIKERKQWTVYLCLLFSSLFSCAILLGKPLLTNPA